MYIIWYTNVQYIYIGSVLLYILYHLYKKGLYTDLLRLGYHGFACSTNWEAPCEAGLTRFASSDRSREEGDVDPQQSSIETKIQMIILYTHTLPTTDFLSFLFSEQTWRCDFKRQNEVDLA